MGRTLSRFQAPVACGIAAVILLALVAPPLIATVGAAIGAPAEPWRALFSPRLLTLLGNSIYIALATTALSVVVGVLLGTVLGRTSLPLVGFALFLHAIPLVLPPFITALTAFHLLGRGGWLAMSATATWLFDDPGCIFVLTVALSPVVTVLTWLGVRGTDPAGDEAARVLMGPWQTLWRVVLPQATPAISLGAIIVFSLALVEIAVPMFLRVDVYSAAVFARLGGLAFSPAEAAALALPLVGVSILMWMLERASPAHRVLALPSARSAPIALLDTRRAKTATALVGLLAAVVGAGPVVVLGLVALEGGGFPLLGTYAGSAILNSLMYATGVSAIVVTLAVVLVSLVHEYPRFIAAQDALAWLAFLLPPALFSIGAIEVWNRPATQWIYGSAAIAVLALAARYAVLAIRIELAGQRQVSPSLNEAARTLGATYLQRLIRIQLPAMRRFTASAWLLVFVFCLRDIETTVLLYPPGGEPLTVRLFTLEANGPPAVIAALSVVLALMTVVPLAAGFLALRTPRWQ
jgi:iron(III) transport system permease protein